jgi:hypothetical protein
MSRFLILLFLLPLFAIGQSADVPGKADLTKIYTLAIKDFIQDAKKKNKPGFDTLYFGKRNDGDPYNDFPDIELPETIENTQIRLISPEEGKVKQNERKTRMYVNMVGWANKEKAEFLLYVFSNGFDYLYNYSLDYKYNAPKKEFELVKLQYKEADKK